MEEVTIDLPGVGPIVLKGAFYTMEATALMAQDGLIMLPKYGKLLESALGRKVVPGDVVMCFHHDSGGYVTGVVDVETGKRVFAALEREMASGNPKG